MDKYDYINLIINFLRGSTGMNFQKNIGTVLKEYYTYKRFTYEMPAALGGDKKNDGWVVEQAVFYQIYAPVKNVKSQKKDMQKKFTEDLSNLLNNVYNKGLWKGKVSVFIYLVNTFDNNLPEDSERYYDKEVERLQNDYGITFDYKVVNLDYIYDVLSDVDDMNVLAKISGKLHINGLFDCNAVDEQSMFRLIMKISTSISEKFMGRDSMNKYEKVSSVEKISINNLDSKREKIEKIISNLDVVENAIRNINQDILFENQFERVKNYVIAKYNELSSELQGTDLYDQLLEDLVTYAGHEYTDQVGAEFLIVYIFDKCDIFKKE